MPIPSISTESRPEASLCLGLMRIGASMLALPVTAIREVICYPQKLAGFPGTTQGLLGAVQLRGVAIPVFDLRHVLGIAPDEDDGKVIVIMRCGGRLLGLLANAVCGLTEVTPHQLRAVSFSGAATQSRIATHSFEHNGEVVVLLDSDCISLVPDMPLVEEKTDRGDDRHIIGAEPLLLFRCQDLHFGVAARMVDATTPRLPIEASALQSEVCLGVIDHHGKEVPVVDLLSILGTTRAARVNESGILVLRFPAGGALGIALDEVREIVRPSPGSIIPMPALATTNHALFEGLMPSAAGPQNFILSVDGLIAHPALASLAKLSRVKVKAGENKRDVGVVTADYEPYLTYSAAGEHATPLIQIAEILSFPDNLIQLDASRPEMLGLFQHRGKVIPLFCLGAVIGALMPRDPQSARVLLVEGEDCTAGFTVQMLRSIERGRRRPAHAAAQAAPGATRSMSDQVVEITVDEGFRLVSRIDLAACLARLGESTRGANLPGPKATTPVALAG